MCPKQRKDEQKRKEEGPGLTLYTIFANIHSTSSTSTSTPCNWRASWNVDMGIRVDLSLAIQLLISSSPFDIPPCNIDVPSSVLIYLPLAPQSRMKLPCPRGTLSLPSLQSSEGSISIHCGSYLVLPRSTLATLARETYAFLNNTLKHPSLALSTTR
jgi:hypothetical protein